MSVEDFKARKQARQAVECRHHNGVLAHSMCEAEVSYRSVRDDSASPYRWPCVDGAKCATRCTQYAPWTPQELLAREADVEDLLREVGERVARGECVHCGTKIAQERQVGRCVYAEPCGHRQGQGKARS